jgi:hypothetical protein
MSTLEKGSFPLPEVARSLSPFIRTRQEALQIRRTLTVYLTSLLHDDGTASGSPLTLTVPDVDILLPEVPSEMSGVSKEYLKAMQAHLIARKEYRAVALRDQDHTASNSYISPSPKGISIGDDAEATTMHTYLALLKQRRRYERLRILRDNIDVLVTKPAAKARYLEISEIQLDALPVLPLQQPPVSIISSGLTESVDELVLRLEKAVLQAKHKLEIEQKLFSKFKVRQQGGRGIYTTDLSAPSDRENRSHALHQTRQELIDWVEQELAKTDVASDLPQHEVGTTDKARPATGDIEQCTRDIESHYGGYIKARKICLATVAEATSTVPLSISEIDPLTSSTLAEQRKSVTDAYCWGLLYSYSRLLVPLNLQRLIAQQKDYIRSSLAMEEEATTQVLDRLADESHLLPSYPLLARDARFQNITAALGSKVSPMHSVVPSGSRTQIKVLEMASRWAFAASAAKSSAQEGLQEKIGQGTDHMGNAQDILSDLVSLLGQRSVAGTESGPQTENEVENIWAPSSSFRARKDKPILKVENGGIPKNIWHGLRGDLR